MKLASFHHHNHDDLKHLIIILDVECILCTHGVKQCAANQMDLSDNLKVAAVWCICMGPGLLIVGVASHYDAPCMEPNFQPWLKTLSM